MLVAAAIAVADVIAEQMNRAECRACHDATILLRMLCPKVIIPALANQAKVLACIGGWQSRVRWSRR